MTFTELVNKICDTSSRLTQEELFWEDYRRTNMLRGINSCRNKTFSELVLLLHSCREATYAARIKAHKDYTALQHIEHSIELICDAVSAVLKFRGETTIVNPTARGQWLCAQATGRSCELV